MRHLLDTRTLSRDEAIMILDTAEDMAATQQREVKKLPTLRGKTVVNLFFEDSTRTRISFEAAAKRLSADVINFSAKGSSVSKGESLKDTALTLQAMGADAVVVRHWASGAAYQLAHGGWLHGSVLNAGDGTHQHPTQALLDAFTMRKHLVDSPIGSDLAGLTVAASPRSAPVRCGSGIRQPGSAGKNAGALAAEGGPNASHHGAAQRQWPHLRHLDRRHVQGADALLVVGNPSANLVGACRRPC